MSQSFRRKRILATGDNSGSAKNNCEFGATLNQIDFDVTKSDFYGGVLENQAS